MLEAVFQVAGGLVLLLAAKAVILTSGRLELSIRTIAAAFIALAGGHFVAAPFAPHCEAAPVADLLLLAGAVLWIGNATWRHRGQPMRRATDFAELDGKPIDRRGLA